MNPKTDATGCLVNRLVRPLRPHSKITPSTWIWDNMYCVWRRAGKLTAKEAIFRAYTHYTNLTEIPKDEPPGMPNIAISNADTTAPPAK